jgi:hypothetical protein
MSNGKVWLFRVLVAVAAVVMLISWSLPWWTIDIEELGPDLVQIRPWGLAVNERLGSFDILIKGAAMPDWFAPCMWAYLGLAMIALLVGLWVRGKEFGIGRFKLNLSQILIGGVGFSYIVAGIIAVVYASIRMRSFYSTPIQGRVYVDLGDMHTYVTTSLLPGYWLIYVAGLLLIVLALLRDKVTGEAKPSAQKSR